MNYYMDFEFHEYKNSRGVNTIEPISMGLVREDGKSLYILFDDFDMWRAWGNTWLRENVFKTIAEEHEVDLENPMQFEEVFDTSQAEAALRILSFIGEDKSPKFHVFYGDYDWVVFCWLFGRMIDLPKHFPYYAIDLKQEMDRLGMEDLEDDGKHSALGDAFYIMEMHKLVIKNDN